MLAPWERQPGPEPELQLGQVWLPGLLPRPEQVEQPEQEPFVRLELYLLYPQKPGNLPLRARVLPHGGNYPLCATYFAPLLKPVFPGRKFL